ncbi:MAG: VWA domain-containing protein [Pyrinomonadaceae bacterium]
MLAKTRLFFVIFGFLILARFANAQDEKIKVESELVRVPVSVIDRDGRFVSNVAKEKFSVFEGGVIQDISFFEPTETPITVMLLADVSGSMDPYMAQIGRALDVFIRQLRPEDTVIVATFDDWAKIDIRVDPIQKKDYKAPKPPNPKRGAPSWPNWTMTSDAVDEAIKLMKNIKGRRAIILFGDGDPSGRYATPETNLRDAEEQEAIIYTIRYGQYPPACVRDGHESLAPLSSSERLGADGIITKPDMAIMGKACWVRKNDIPKLIQIVDKHMNGLAEKTGGRAYQIEAVSSLAETFSKIVSELGQTYTIGYEPKIPPKAGERRKITAKVDIPNVAVRSRNEVVYSKPKK